jgi:hypothetical protein
MRDSLTTLMVGFLVGLVACKAPERARPTGVPADAVWAGRGGHGHFISCGYGMGRELIPCRVFNDQTGAVEAEGRFALTGIPRDTSPQRFRYSFFDGKRIYLQDGSVLNPSREPATDGGPEQGSAAE